MRAEILEQAEQSAIKVVSEEQFRGNDGLFTLAAGETLTFPETDTKYFELQIRNGAQVISSSFYLEQPGEVPENGANYIEANFDSTRFENRLRERLLALRIAH